MTEFVCAAIISLALGLMVTFASDGLNERASHRAEVIAAQFSTLAGEPYVVGGVATYYAPFQNRVLFPLLFAAVSQIKLISTSAWFELLRFGIAVLLLVVCWWVLRRVADTTLKQTAAGCLLLAYSLVFTFNVWWEHTSDYPDAIFTLLLIAATVARNRFGVVVIALLAAANRESAAFAGVLWICVYGLDAVRKVQWRELAFGAGVSIAAYAAVLALRFAFGGPKAIDASSQWVMVFSNLLPSMWAVLTHPGISSWPVLAFAMFAPVVLWIAANYGVLGALQKRLLAAALAMTALSLVFGVAVELRIFIPPLVTLVVVAAWGEALASRNQVTPSPA
ncbi:MAG: hypothetical protein HZB53_04930 [Chloroflexi bacterium]|nr:hypothetical protein [Chloroflexota bacterium]